MKTFARVILILATAAAVWSSGAAFAGAQVTMRDFTAPRNAAYEKWARESAGKKAQDQKVCRAGSCPVRSKATVPEPKAKPTPVLGGFRLLPS